MGGGGKKMTVNLALFSSVLYLYRFPHLLVEILTGIGGSSPGKPCSCMAYLRQLGSCMAYLRQLGSCMAYLGQLGSSMAPQRHLGSRTFHQQLDS